MTCRHRILVEQDGRATSKRYPKKDVVGYCMFHQKTDIFGANRLGARDMCLRENLVVYRSLAVQNQLVPVKAPIFNDNII